MNLCNLKVDLFSFRCDKLTCIDLMYMHPEISNDTFSKCHKLKHVNLQKNDLNLDQILDIEEQLLSPLNNITYLKIRERSLKCPLCQSGSEQYCNCTNCKTVNKLNDLFNIAPETDITCYLDESEVTINETRKYFTEALHDCETCMVLVDNKFKIIAIVISLGKFK